MEGIKRKENHHRERFSAPPQLADIRDSSSFLALLASEFPEAVPLLQDEDVAVALASLSSSLQPCPS
jgi:hypothetical protein